MAEEPATRSGGTEDTIPAADLDEAEPKSAPAPEERYRLGTELGRGGMGRVVEAYDTQLGRTVALKEVLPSGSTNIIKRFEREVRITARLEHASIVPLYDSGLMTDGRPFYVMRRVSGRPLDELIAHARSLEERLALLPNVLAAIDAIGHAHRRGVIHRDLKPANILVGDLGETVVIDWGLAKVVGEEEPPPASFEPYVPSAGDSLKTQIGAVFGTPGFMAPEQARGDELDPRSDVYALGATLYQLLAGRPPIAGSSATEMIASTATKRVAPLAKVAPNAPPELATIIDKALSFEADARYPDAGALAEDVRRFTTGQLVGAHRYTRRQRIARFARRHRAALVVAALAATAVAVLSWVSVHRILKERDTATRAQTEAERQRALADTKAREARQRADQVLLAHANALLDTNPTAAIAILKQLDPNTPVLDGAKAVAKAAVARGVAWGLRSLPGATTSFEMTRDGNRLLQVNREGKLQVLDLERRKQLLARDLPANSGAHWVDDDRKLLIDRYKQTPQLFDPMTGKLDDIGALELRDIAKTSDGQFVAYIDVENHVGVIDVAKGTVTQVWKGVAEHTIAIAEDGSWIAFGDQLGERRHRLVVVDRAGRLMLERPGNVTVTGVSRGGRLGFSMFEEVFEVMPALPAPVFTKLPIERKEAVMIHQIIYRDEVMHLVGARNVLTFTRDAVFRSDSIGDTTYFMQLAENRVNVVTASDRTVHLLRDGAHHIMRLTDEPEGMYRVATGSAGARVAATTKDSILIWEMSDLFPRVIDAMPGIFIGNRRLLVPTNMVEGWTLLELDGDKRTQIKAAIEGLPIGYQSAPDEGRVLVTIRHSKGTSALMLYADGRQEHAIEDIATGRACLILGNALAYSVGNRVFGKVGSERAHELVTVAGDVISIAGAGKLGYAALGSTGELVRGTFGGSSFTRAHVRDVAKSAFIVADPTGMVYVGSGNRLLRWRGDVHELARFAADIDFIDVSELGIYVMLVTKDVFFVPATGNQTPQRIPISTLSSVSGDGKALFGLTPSQQIEVVDMPAAALWTLPRLFSGKIVASPDGQRVLQNIGMQTAIWRIAQPGSDFAAWLAELTNATEDAGHVRWPWQP